MLSTREFVSPLATVRGIRSMNRCVRVERRATPVAEVTASGVISHSQPTQLGKELRKEMDSRDGVHGEFECADPKCKVCSVKHATDQVIAERHRILKELGL
jgi:hypothetical protein